MPKSEYPESVQDLPEDDYDQWTAVYHSARDDGDSKETAAKKAWGAINESDLQEDEDPCWEDYEMVGMKTKNGKKVPNCVPKKEAKAKKPLKVTKEELKRMVREAVREQLLESIVDKRIRQLDRYKIESGVSYYELLEDIVEHLDDNTWNNVLEGLREKYGYRL